MKIHKMKRLVFVLLAFLILLFIFFFLPVVWGQSIYGEKKLVKVPTNPLLEGLECGEYFVRVSDDEGRLMIGFIFEIEPRVLVEQAFLPEEIFVIPDNRRSVPTIKFTKKGPIKVIVRISEGGLKKSQCLQRCSDKNRT